MHGNLFWLPVIIGLANGGMEALAPADYSSTQSQVRPGQPAEKKLESVKMMVLATHYREVLRLALEQCDSGRVWQRVGSSLLRTER